MNAAPDSADIRLVPPDGSFVAGVDLVGARVSSIMHVATETEFLLRAPWAGEDWAGAHVPATSNERWHQRYAGGWHALVPHAGDARTLDGVEHPFHGEAAWRRWRVVERTGSSCTLAVMLRTVPFTVRRRIEVTDSGLRVRQTVRNESGLARTFTWTEHPAFGDALLGTRSTLTVGGEPVETGIPSDGGTHSGFRTIDVRGRGPVLLRDDDTGASALLSWDTRVMPFLHIWQEHHRSTGFPWWGAIDTLALEPASRPYDPDPHELGPLILEPGASMTAHLTLDLTPPEREPSASTGAGRDLVDLGAREPS